MHYFVFERFNCWLFQIFWSTLIFSGGLYLSTVHSIYGCGPAQLAMLSHAVEDWRVLCALHLPHQGIHHTSTTFLLPIIHLARAQTTAGIHSAELKVTVTRFRSTLGLFHQTIPPIGPYKAVSQMASNSPRYSIRKLPKSPWDCGSLFFRGNPLYIYVFYWLPVYVCNACLYICFC
jgi:hypothetical protein